MYIELEELMERLKMAFGNLNNDCGCYVDHRNEYDEMAMRILNRGYKK